MSRMALPIAPGLELWPVDPFAIRRNPLAHHQLVEFHDDTPPYPPSWFDADGYLTRNVIVAGHWPAGDGCWRNADTAGNPCNAPVPDDDPLGLCPTHHHQLRSDA